jgi:TRAP-type C4-dicarboxylate transport system substrate-binding protein
VYEDGYLGDDSEVVEQLRFGGIDIAVVSLRALDGTAKSAALLGKGGSFSSAAAMAEAIDGELGSELAEELESSRLLLLSWYDGGPECYLLPRADGPPSLAGLRIGVERSKAVIDELTAAGAIPVPLSTLEFRRALEAGLVDGVRAPLALALSSRLDADYRVVPLPGSRVPMLVIGSRVSLMKMPGYDREALSESLRASKVFQSDAMAFMEARFARDNPRPWTLPLSATP